MAGIVALQPRGRLSCEAVESVSVFPSFPVFLSLSPPSPFPPLSGIPSTRQRYLYFRYFGVLCTPRVPPLFPFPSSSSHFLPPFTWKFSYLLHMTTWEEWEASVAKSDNPLVLPRGGEKEKVQPGLASSNSCEGGKNLLTLWKSANLWNARGFTAPIEEKERARCPRSLAF